MRTLLTILVWVVVALPASAQHRAFVERFDTSDTATFPPMGWVEINASKSSSSGWENTSLRKVSLNQLGPDAAGHDDYGPDVENDTWLITPPIDLIDFHNPRLVFDQSLGYANKMAHHPDHAGDGMSQVLASTDGITWVRVWRETRTEDGKYLAVEVPLDKFARETELLLAFRYYGTFAHTWVIDNVIVDSGSPGPPLLEADGLCPGDTDFRMQNMTPRGVVWLLWSLEPTPTSIPDGPCAGEFVPLIDPVIAFEGIADDRGQAVYPAYIPSAACGVVWVSGYDLESCTTTNVVGL